MSKHSTKYFQEQLRNINKRLKESGISQNWQITNYDPLETYDKIPQSYLDKWSKITVPEGQESVPEIENLLHDGNIGAEDAVYQSFYIGTGYNLEAIPGDGYLDDIVDGILHGMIFDEDACYEAYNRGKTCLKIANNLHAGL